MIDTGSADATFRKPTSRKMVSQFCGEAINDDRRYREDEPRGTTHTITKTSTIE